MSWGTQLEENYEITLVITLLLGKGVLYKREGTMESFGNDGYVKL